MGPLRSQVATKDSGSSITQDSALQYLEQSGGTETFDEFQTRSKGQATQVKTQQSLPLGPNIGHVEVDQDDADLQQALHESRQQVQLEGSDPAASSSASAQLSTQDALQAELQNSHELQRESDHLEQKMVGSGLTPDELERFRKVSQLLHTNKLRVAELIYPIGKFATSTTVETNAAAYTATCICSFKGTTNGDAATTNNHEGESTSSYHRKND